MRSRPPRPGRRALAPLLNLFLLAPLFLYLWVVVRTAWLSDDAYISFRAIDNLLGGMGPVWNPGERVQSFSHPLWFLLLTPFRALTGEFYFATLFLSIVVSIATAIVLAFAGSGSWLRRMLAVTLCCFSGAFVDFSTSGLENPLSHLLVAILYFGLMRQQPALPRSYFLICLPAGLAVLNRLDLLVLVMPPLVAEAVIRVRSGLAVIPGGNESGFWKRQRPGNGALYRRFASTLLAGFFPLLLWEAFSVVYYGFPFPNTAYAKLNTGIPHLELVTQGLYYFAHTLKHDPTTLAVIAAGILGALAEPSGRTRSIAVGILLYLAYVVWIGGDFMAGRFLSVPFFVSVLLISDLSLSPFPAVARWIFGAVLASVAAASVALAPNRTPVLSGPDYPKRPPEAISYDWRGVGDERGAYYPWTGLLREKPDENSPDTHFWAKLGAGISADPPKVAVLPGIGLAGWQVGEVYAVDLNALTDPLLARIPAMREPAWRIGHFTRALPPGYLDSLVWDEARITDAELASYFNRLRLVTRGPVFTRARFTAVWELNRHPWPAHIDSKAYQYPPADASAPARRHFRAGEFNGSPSGRTLPGGEAFALYWPTLRRENALRFTPRPTTDYNVLFYQGGELAGKFIVRRQPREAQGGPPDDAPAMIALPSRIARDGWDRVEFIPREFAGPQPIRTIIPARRRGP